MAARVTSVFLYVKDVRRSLEFYNEVVGAKVLQVHAEHEGAPLSLAILRLDDFTLMIHPQEAARGRVRRHAAGCGNSPPDPGRRRRRVYQHCMDEGAILSLSGEPTDQPWGWREFALRDPDGFVWSIYQDKSGGQWTG